MAFPGLVAWISSSEDTDGISLKIEGYEAPVMPMQTPQPMPRKRNGQPVSAISAAMTLSASSPV